MNITKSNFYVFTGGPGSGKSTLLHALKELGFTIVAETGRQIIKDRLQNNLSPRPAPAEFARQMFEIDFTKFIRNTGADEIVFFDRSFLDSAALLSEVDNEYFKKVESIVRTCRFNNKIFLAPPWKEIYRNDKERDQTFDEAIEVHRRMSDWYAANNYQLIEIPKMSISERVNFILDQIKHD